MFTFILSILGVIWGTIKIALSQLFAASTLGVIWRVIKSVGKGLNYAAKGLFYLSRLPGDLVIAVLKMNGWFPENECGKPLMAVIYFLSGVITVVVLIFLWRWIFW